MTPMYPVDARIAALHLSRIYEKQNPTDRRIDQWECRIRQWAHRYPRRVHRFGHIGRRTLYDLGQLEDLAYDLLRVPTDSAA